jgi:hypothetical protein
MQLLVIQFTIKMFHIGFVSTISIHIPCMFYYFVLCPTNAQLFHKLSHPYMFRHYRVILRELVINTLPSYTTVSNAAVGNIIYNQHVSYRFYLVGSSPGRSPVLSLGIFFPRHSTCPCARGRLSLWK